MSPRIASGVVIHGGVGTVPRSEMTRELEAEYRAALAESLGAGHRVLERGGTAIDATVAAVQVMEDSPLFNAGRGSNFDERGVVTMDASIMDGATRSAGAVAAVREVRSPVHLARLVMEESGHLLLVGEGAQAFARAHGIEPTEASFFHTERRAEALARAKERGGRARPNVLGDDDSEGPRSPELDASAQPDSLGISDRSGTVGAVARDRQGRLAAATSTGGMANKTWGRVGDSPIIGAGTYASTTCAVSCTGWGEYFIRNAAAFDVHARMEYRGDTLEQAARAVIFDVLEAQVERAGGLVALDSEGRIEMCFSTPGMYRGWVGSDGNARVAIYRGG